MLLVLAGCPQSVSPTFDQCELDLTLEVAEAASGDALVVLGGPQTETFDTVVLMGDVQAEIQSVDRTGCNACETCRDNLGCSDCQECRACEDSCNGCTESLTAIVPDLESGTTTLVVLNGSGQSQPLALEIVDRDLDTDTASDTDVDTDTDTDVDTDTDTDVDTDTDSDTDNNP